MRRRMFRYGAGMALAACLAAPLSFADDVGCDGNSYEFIANTFPTLEKRYEKSIVLLSCAAALPDHTALGTGFLIDSRMGLFLTARHVIKDPVGSKYDCTAAGTTVYAYVLGDMCEEDQLEVLATNEKLDVALLRMKGAGGGGDARNAQRPTNSFASRPYFELLLGGMTKPEELELIGFSELAATLIYANADSDARKNLPAKAGGHPCNGRTQPYHANNPAPMIRQIIVAKSPVFLRDYATRNGDSGGPVFLADGRVAGIPVKMGFGDFSAGTRVSTARDIGQWLTTVLAAQPQLSQAYAVEALVENDHLDEALNPSLCVPGITCIPNVQLAVQLDRIEHGDVDVRNFGSREKDRLACPIYRAARMRLAFSDSKLIALGQILKSFGVQLAALPGYKAVARAKAIFASDKYTANTKLAAFSVAEESLAADVAAVWRRHPTVVTKVACKAGIGAALSHGLATALNNYLGDMGSELPEPSQGDCSGAPDAAVAKQLGALTAMLADVKILERSLRDVDNAKAEQNTASVVALNALFNSGSEKGAAALVDFGDIYVKKDPELAAAAYAKSFAAGGSHRALAGFGEAIERSQNGDLREASKDAKTVRQAITSPAVKSLLPEFDARIIAETAGRLDVK